MNCLNPKIKLILLILVSPIFSLLNGNIEVSELSEMGYLWGFPADLAQHAEDTNSSQRDFSVYQLSFHAANLSSGITDGFVQTILDIKPTTPTTWAHLSKLSAEKFLIAQHFSSSFLRGFHQSYTLARFLLWEVYLL